MQTKTRTLSSGEIVMWDLNDPDGTALVYTPPEDKMLRYHNSP